LEYVETSAFLEIIILIASGYSEKNLKNNFKFGTIFFDAVNFYFSKNKNFHGNLPEAGRLRELGHQQYELDWFDHYINIA
jgi:hypothetical protein